MYAGMCHMFINLLRCKFSFRFKLKLCNIYQIEDETKSENSRDKRFPFGEII